MPERRTKRPETRALRRIRAGKVLSGSVIGRTPCSSVDHRLDAVPIRIDDEGSVVVRPVVRAQAGRAVVLAAFSQRGLVKTIDRCVVRRGEGQVETRTG